MVTEGPTEAELRPLVEKIVRKVLREMIREQSRRLASIVGPAEERWGYAFGCDGVMPADEALTLLGVRTQRTLRRYRANGFIRLGYRQPGKPSSGVVVCRRSLRQHLAGCEK